MLVCDQNSSIRLSAGSAELSLCHQINDFMEKKSVSLFLAITSVETRWSNLPWLSFVVKGVICLGYIWRVKETKKPPVSH